MSGSVEENDVGARYAYFRDEKGRPKKDNPNFGPQTLLAEVGKAGKLNGEGKYCWEGFSVFEFKEAFLSVFVVLDKNGHQLNDFDAWSILRGAMRDVGEKNIGQPLTIDNILKAADVRASTFFREPSKPFVLVTSLSVKDLPQSPIASGDCVVTPIAERGNFVLPGILTSNRVPRFRSHLESSKYQLVKVDCKGKSIYDAVDNGLRAVTLLRGLWSLVLTIGRFELRFGDTSRKTLGVIHPGPVHTLHLTDGKPVNEQMYWYEAEYTEEQELFEGKTDWAKIESWRTQAMDKMKMLAFKDDFEDLLIRYASALDQSNHNVAFLQMWSILEKLTNTIGVEYDKTIQRTVWILKEADALIAKDILDALRFRRNQYVHSGKSSESPDEIAYMLKRILDPHLFGLIENPLKVKSLEEYAEILSLPADEKVLKDRLSKVIRAIRAKRTKKSSS